MRKRSKIIAHHRLPLDWSAEEVQKWQAVAKLAQQAKDEGKLTVLVTGVFDLFHQEHLTFLKKARAAGNFLMVGIESDLRTKHLKGEGRPINNQGKRVKNIEETGLADIVEVLPEAFDQPDHHRHLLSLLRPNILAVSSHTPYLESKRQLVALFGGKLQVVHQHNPNVSTTIAIGQRKINPSD